MYIRWICIKMNWHYRQVPVPVFIVPIFLRFSFHFFLLFILLLLSLLLLCSSFHSTHLNAIILLNYLIWLIVKGEMNKIHIISIHTHARTLTYTNVLQLYKMILNSVEIKRIEHVDEVFCQYEVTELLLFTLDFNRESFQFNSLKCKYIHAYSYLLAHINSPKEGKRRKSTSFSHFPFL